MASVRDGGRDCERCLRDHEAGSSRGSRPGRTAQGGYHAGYHARSGTTRGFLAGVRRPA